MNQPPEKTDSLVNFLRQYRPDIPPASAQLEERILAALTSSDRPKSWRYSQSILGLIIATMAATASLAFWGLKTRLFFPTSATESAQIEAFMEYTWNGLLQDEMLDPSTDFIFVEEESPAPVKSD